MTALNRKPHAVESRTVFRDVHSVSQIFARRDPDDPVARTVEVQDVHVYVGSEGLSSCIRRHETPGARPCEEFEIRPRRGVTEFIHCRYNVGLAGLCRYLHGLASNDIELDILY